MRNASPVDKNEEEEEGERVEVAKGEINWGGDNRDREGGREKKRRGWRYRRARKGGGVGKEINSGE